MDVLSRLRRWLLGDGPTVELDAPTTVAQDGTVDATVTVDAGDDARTLTDATVVLETEHHADEGPWTHARASLLDDQLTLEPDATRSFDVTLPVSAITPPSLVTERGTPVSVRLRATTDVDADGDPSDRHRLFVETGGPFGAVHAALTERLGLTVRSLHVARFDGGDRCTEISYRAGANAEYPVDDLELKFNAVTADGLELHVDVSFDDDAAPELVDGSGRLAVAEDADVDAAVARLRAFLDGDRDG